MWLWLLKTLDKNHEGYIHLQLVFQEWIHMAC